jgi:hypothetical protein
MFTFDWFGEKRKQSFEEIKTDNGKVKKIFMPF